MNFLWDLSSKIKKNYLILSLFRRLSCNEKPQESLLNSDFDIVLKSTNVDFVLLELCDELRT